MISRLELKTKAKESLRGHWILAIGVTLIYMAISMIASYIPFVGTVAMIFCAPAFSLGLIKFFLKLSRNENVDIEMLFSGFSQFIKAFCVSFMMGLIIFLWSLLLIIPGAIVGYQYINGYDVFSGKFTVGLFVILLSIVLMIPAIVASYRYFMVYYILSDNPDMGVMEILKESKRLTQGYKGAIFVLHLSFIGWGLLAIIPCGLGFLWLQPYIATTMANMYSKLVEIKGDNNLNNDYLNNDNYNNGNNDNLNSYNNFNYDNANNLNDDNLNNNVNNEYLNNDYFNNTNLNNNFFNDENNLNDNNSNDNNSNDINSNDNSSN